MDEIGDRLSTNTLAVCQNMNTNNLSVHIIEYNKNIKNIKQGFMSNLNVEQASKNACRHIQSNNTKKRLINELEKKAAEEDNEDKKCIIKYQIEAMKLMQSNLTEVKGIHFTNKPPPTSSLVDWLSKTVQDYAHSDYYYNHAP